MTVLHYLSTLPRDSSPMAQNEPTGDIPTPHCPLQPKYQHALTVLDWGLLPLLMTATPLIYLFRARYNLPVASNVDERTSLEILLRFHNGSLNPGFFMYPTLYYYVTYLFVNRLPISQFLLWGRILNLSLVGLTAFIAYSFARLHFRSRVAGILSAAFIITSPIIVNSGAYLCTDVLLAASALATLLFLTQYFHESALHSWILSMVMIGLAVGCKYTAFLLFIAYVGTEMIREVDGNDRDIGRDPGLRIPSHAFSAAFAVLGGLCLTSAWIFPLTSLMRFASAHHTNADLRNPADYLLFFHHVRMLLIYGGAALLAAALLVLRSAYLYRVLSLRRLYLGLLIVLFVALLTTPYSVFDASKFIYDIGALARNNIVVQSGHAQWKSYWAWLVRDESRTLLTLGLVGFATVALRSYWRYSIVIIFAAIYILTIGNSHLGFSRYLTPILPVIYLLAAGFLAQAWATHSPSFRYVRILTVMLVVLATTELWPKIESSRASSKQTDPLWDSYRMAMNLHPTRILYAGDAPSVELSASGIPVSQTSWASLGGMAMGNELDCGELLIFDHRGAEMHSINPDSDPSVTVLLDDRVGDYGQEVLRRADCK
jgi:hypothetical protein